MAQAYNKSINKKCNCWISGGSASVRYLLFTVPADGSRSLIWTQREMKLGITDRISTVGRGPGSRKWHAFWRPINASLATAQGFVGRGLIFLWSPFSRSTNCRPISCGTHTRCRAGLANVPRISVARLFVDLTWGLIPKKIISGYFSFFFERERERGFSLELIYFSLFFVILFIPLVLLLIIEWPGLPW